jgi:prepilin peptidase CpaA
LLSIFFVSNSQYLLLGLLGIALVCDVIARRVPNLLVGIGAVTGLSLSFIDGAPVNTTQSLLGALLAFLIFYYPYAKAYIGAGDVKLFALVGLFLGPSLGMWAFLFSCVSGGLIAIVFGLIKSRFGGVVTDLKSLDRYQMDVPYAVAIFVGSSMAIFNLQKILLDA